MAKTGERYKSEDNQCRRIGRRFLRRYAGERAYHPARAGDRIHEPAFAALIESGDFCKPYTDGKAIRWPGGTSIPLEDILAMLLSPGDVTRNQNHKEDLR